MNGTLTMIRKKQKVTSSTFFPDQMYKQWNSVLHLYFPMLLAYTIDTTFSVVEKIIGIYELFTEAEFSNQKEKRFSML